MIGLQVDRELLEDQGEVAALVARVAIQRAADVEQDFRDSRGGRRRLGHRRIGRHRAVHHHRVGVLVAEGLQQRARIVGLAETAQPVGRRDDDAQGRRIELDGAAILGLRRRLVARHLLDLSLDRHDRRLGTLIVGLQPGKGRACSDEILLPGAEPGHHELAQRTELVFRSDAAELLLGGAVVAALDLLDGQHEIGDPVARLDGQDLRGELRGGIDPAGIGAQPEGAVHQLEVTGSLRQGKVELVGAVLVVVVLLGHPAGEVSAAERDRGDLPAGDARLLPAAARLGVTCERNRKHERRRQQRKGNGSHTCHMFG